MILSITTLIITHATMTLSMTIKKMTLSKMILSIMTLRMTHAITTLTITIERCIPA
jgi:hypothetical protein